MSLGIVIKGPEGLILASESRVTLTAQGRALPGAPNLPGGLGGQMLSVTFDHATKLLAFSAPHTYVGAVTFGQAIIGLAQPRTPASFIPELEASLPQQRVSVAQFAQLLSAFYLQQWQERMPPPPSLPSPSPEQPAQPGGYTGLDVTFVVGGFDEGAAYGRIFQFGIPSAPIPVEQNADPAFGLLWGGQQEIVDRLVKGYDPNLLLLAASALQLDPDEVVTLRERLDALQLALPINFLALQDCVDLAILLIRTTIAVQQLTISVRGVGGAIDVATITRQEGLRFVQRKQVVGETSGGM